MLSYSAEYPRKSRIPKTAISASNHGDYSQNHQNCNFLLADGYPYFDVIADVEVVDVNVNAK
ncbi:hypothetical protein G9P44_004532 [Scheffersomyces stipitis]|nr:hypothetical protein G9P44_004532 [Scheffersomyces stipitis]